ncbi:MAG: GH3 auxin-responsive promoter family protein [Myxococcales bacterium]|nr:GH3 auxin-responsive promoter family protein [Myxococcales bacterium]
MNGVTSHTEPANPTPVIITVTPPMNRDDRRRQIRAWNDVLVRTFAPAAIRFRRQLGRPGHVQRRRLRDLLERAQGTAFGRAHGFAGIDNVARFQSRVPIATWDDIAPWAERVANGELHVLTGERVRAIERSSGSTGARKDVPITDGLLREFRAAVYPWMHDLLTRRPALQEGSAYWAISPIVRKAARTVGGLPIGLDSDAAYLGPGARIPFASLLSAPSWVALLPDVATCRYVTARFLLADRELALLSVWSPTFLSLLQDQWMRHSDRLIDDIAEGTLSPPGGLAEEIRSYAESETPWAFVPDPHRARQVKETGLEPKAIWPKLTLISAWTAGSSAGPAHDLADRFRGVELQGKGLLATEGVVSIPILGTSGTAATGSVLAITSHFLELEAVELPGRPIHLADEARAGALYSPLLTTGGGLYRYRLGDLVRVVGFEGRTPRVEFVGREDGRVDLAGEKLSPGFVASCFGAAARKAQITLRFEMLSPDSGDVPPHYLAAIEPRASLPVHVLTAFESALEAQLRENPHYAWCRDLGQLGPVEVLSVRDGAARYEARALSEGRRAGDLKPMPLVNSSGWRAWFLNDASERSDAP